MRRKNPETLLKEALDADDNLAILKAHRRIIVKDLITCDDPADRVRLNTSLTQVNKEIIRLEGAKEVKDDDIQAAYAEHSALLSGGLSVVVSND